MRLRKFFFVGSIVLALTLGGASSICAQPGSEPQPDDHTDPPILIFKGGLLWLKASSEDDTECHLQADPDQYCDGENSDYPLCKTLRSLREDEDGDGNYEWVKKSYCMKSLETRSDIDYSIFDDKGNCTAYAKKLDLAFTLKGTAWAKQKNLTTPRRGNTYTLKGKDPDDNWLKMTFVVGDDTTPNTWVIKKKGAPDSCTVSSDPAPANNIAGYVPKEFLYLTKLKRWGFQKTPLAFAACLNDLCAD